MAGVEHWCIQQSRRGILPSHRYLVWLKIDVGKPIEVTEVQFLYLEPLDGSMTLLESV
jgi:hypothetical protein